ncbi:MAG: ATP-dependent Clp protease proteolytic subunit [Chlorobi bacterium]|nr:ATP-dependent Clp protease proteolytic subunit [Chlorobiota bacterium]
MKIQYIKEQFVFLLLLFSLTGASQVHGQTNVYVIEVSGDVDLGLGPYVERVVADANNDPSAVVLLHVNTFGGRVDVATKIKDAVINSVSPTIAFVDKRAISAGALITLSAEKITMAPGGSIGAATPVYQTGEKASEKVVSYMRGEMRATAEKNGRDPAIAEAMVDEEVVLSDTTLKRAGKLLTLTTEEAVDVGYCDTVVNSVEEALSAFGYHDVVIQNAGMNWAESLVRVLTSPFLSSLLIMLGLGGLFYAVKTGHFGAVSIVGISAIVLFFGAQYLVNLANALEIIMFAAGVLLLGVELFVIPGFGVAGVSGIILMVLALFLALIGSFDAISMDSLSTPLYTLAGALVGFGVIAWLMIKFLPNSSAFRRFALFEESVGGAELPEAALEKRLRGATGSAITTLRPAGVAFLNGDQYDVVSDGEFIPAGQEIYVVHVEGRKIVVRRLPEMMRGE